MHTKMMNLFAGRLPNLGQDVHYYLSTSRRLRVWVYPLLTQFHNHNIMYVGLYILYVGYVDQVVTRQTAFKVSCRHEFRDRAADPDKSAWSRVLLRKLIRALGKSDIFWVGRYENTYVILKTE